ncbi:MAG: InlB B-repeat-containing protein [Clostridia bacterium]|nr:InlB B-repeat-containing protein [Clostridia bacterium]
MKKLFVKAVSVVLSASVILSCAVFALAAGDEKYTGKILMAVNTDYNFFTGKDGSYSVSTSAKKQGADSANAGEQPDIIPTANDVFGKINVASPEEYREYLRTHKDEPQAVPANEYCVGDTLDIIAIMATDIVDIQTGEINEGTDGEDVIDKAFITIKCIYTNDSCTVWTQIRDDGTQCNTNEEARKAAEIYDSFHKEEEQVFGPNLIDTDGDGKFALIGYDFAQDSGVIGYFYSEDLTNEYGFVGNVFAPVSLISNHMDCVYFNTDYLGDKTTLVHEYQHYLFECNQFYGKTNFNYVPFEEKFVTEGFSRCAEVMFGGYTIDDFNYAATLGSDISLTKWDTASGDNLFYCYEIGGAFFNYMRNRYAILTGDKSEDFAGKGLFLDFHGRRNILNQFCSMEIFGEMLYPDADYPALRTKEAKARQLIIDFWKAVLLNEKSGIYGFNGENVVFINPHYFIKDRLPGSKETLRPGMANFYYIDSGKTADVKVKEKSGNIYTEAINSGYTVTFDYNDPDEPYSYTDFYIASEEITVDYNYRTRFGYYLSGWSENKKAQNPDYKPGDSFVIEKDTVLYAVWKNAPEVTAGRDYTPGDYGEVTVFIFIPDESGNYTFTKTNPKTGTEYSGLYISGIDTYVGAESYYYNNEETNIIQKTVSLEKGKKYQFTIMDRSDFRIDKETESYTLTFMVDGKEYRSFSGRTKYSFIASYYYIDGYNFCGWSSSADSANPEYLPGNNYDIELSQDTVLYAVYTPCEVINSGSAVNIERGYDGQQVNYIFIPESDGTYSFEFTTLEGETDWGYFGVYDEKGKYVGDIYSGTETGAFAGDCKYIIAPGTNIESFTIEKISDEADTELLLVDGAETVYSDSGKPAYIIPDTKPEESYKGIFNGWGYYEAGETVFVLRNTKTLSSGYDKPYIYIFDKVTFDIDFACYNKTDDRYYVFIPSYIYSLYKITAKDGSVYVDPSVSDEWKVCFRETDDCLLICPLYDRYSHDVPVMFSSGVTEFTVEKIDAPVTVTYSAEGASDVPAPQTINGSGYISCEEPQMKNAEFIGWKYEYNSYGTTVYSIYGPGDKIIADKDITLTAIFEKPSVIERIISWFESLKAKIRQSLILLLQIILECF